MLDLILEHLELVGVAGVGQAQEELIALLRLGVAVVEVTVASDPPCQVHVFLLDGDALGMDGAEVGVLEDTDDVGLGGFLEGLDGLRLEPQLVVHVSGDALDEALERGTREKHVDGLLVPLHLAEGDGTGLSSELPLLFNSSGGRSCLLDGLGDGHPLGVSLGFSCNFGLGHSDGGREVDYFENLIISLYRNLI